jgi:hypothetical protein
VESIEVYNILSLIEYSLEMTTIFPRRLGLDDLKAAILH